jgi:hypothetical protein
MEQLQVSNVRKAMLGEASLKVKTYLLLLSAPHRLCSVLSFHKRFADR